MRKDFIAGLDGTDRRFLDMMAEKHGFTYNLTFAQGFDSAIRLVNKIFLLIFWKHFNLIYFSLMNGKLT